jgi:hypothetical protein
MEVVDLMVSFNGEPVDIEDWNVLATAKGGVQ